MDMQNDVVLPTSPFCIAGAHATLPAARKLPDVSLLRHLLPHSCFFPGGEEVNVNATGPLQKVSRSAPPW